MKEKQIYFTKLILFHEGDQTDFGTHYVIKSTQKVSLQSKTTSNKQLKQ